MIYFGICENRDDPLKLGRLQVRVFGVHNEDLIKIPTDKLPWASVMMPTTGSSISGIGHSPSSIVEGSMVVVVFLDGESKQMPAVIGTLHGIPNAQEFVKKSFSNAANINIHDDSEIVEQANPGEVDVNKPIDEQPPVQMTEQTGYPTSEQIAKMMAKLRMLESTNNYRAINSIGFVGAYQFGTPRLEDLGYVVPGTTKSYTSSKRAPNRALTVDSVWVGKDGIRSLNDFLNSPNVQDNIIKSSFLLSYKRLVKLGTISDKSPTNQIAGYIFASHLKGEGGAANLKKGIDGNDANGTKASKYFKDGYAIIGGDISSEAITTALDPEGVKPQTSRQASSSGVSTSTVAQGDQIGFKDPNKKYPLSTRLKEPDTHRLARRITSDTFVEQKDKQRTQGIRTVDGTWAQPVSPYNSVYPYNHMFFTESGHALEFDDTPGSERINLFHTSGSFLEIDKFGNSVNKIIGDGFEVCERNGYVFVRGTKRESIGGDLKIIVEGNCSIEVDGNYNLDVGSDMNVKVGGSFNLHSANKLSMVSNSNFAVDASKVYLNSGQSTKIGTSSRSGETVDYDLLIPENYRGSNVFTLDDAESEYVDEYYARGLQTGQIKQEDLDTGKIQSQNPQSVDDSKTSFTGEKIDASCSAAFAGMDVPPPELQISKYYTIGSFTTKTTFPNRLQKNKGLSEKEIACNLRKLALNVVDKIKEKFPTVFITSGFRNNQNGSQHNIGQACDMQFSGFTKDDYFEAAKWIKANVIFDQLLLEYQTTGSGNPWIHISYTDKPRGEVKTFMNHSVVGSGLRKLQ